MNHYQNTVTGAEFWSERECQGGDWIKVESPSESKDNAPKKQPRKSGRKKES